MHNMQQSSSQVGGSLVIDEALVDGPPRSCGKLTLLIVHEDAATVRGDNYVAFLSQHLHVDVLWIIYMLM